jgi:hypothetical protein
LEQYAAGWLQQRTSSPLGRELKDARENRCSVDCVQRKITSA